jgi:hypothetical protein
MIAPQAHLRIQHDRIADVARDARRHPLAAVDPVERRASTRRLRRRVAAALAPSRAASA